MIQIWFFRITLILLLYVCYKVYVWARFFKNMAEGAKEVAENDPEGPDSLDESYGRRQGVTQFSAIACAVIIILLFIKTFSR
jgi:hypothetical protein